ncbi:hypothetical protein [Clostridium felsineum]|uniref:hypothetical protein n=1 Tax=Clostridium felsineum TaxID=36839 RepID=UPI0009D4969F|nr:hypothetical protein [Clostridium felsineum]URZ02582.1 hypothetical protein CLAUR_025940 [Clostridium felsineum]
MADKIKMEYMIMDSMTSEFRKMGGNLDNITKDLNKILVSLELSYISAASLIMCQNITDSLKIGKQITNNIYKLSIKLNDAKVALANSDKDLAAAMGLASGAVLYRGNDDEDLNKVLKETDKTTKEVDGLLKEFDKFEKEEEIEKKAWYNRPAKEDIFDKVEYWFTGKKPRVRTQGEEVIAAQYTEMAFSNQNFAAELQSEFEIGARGLASMDRINEVMENSEEMPVVNVGKNGGNTQANDYGKYATLIDSKVKEIEKVNLPEWIGESFTDENYRTVITEENITFYRTYGGGAKVDGSFVTTTPAGNRINAKINTALVPDWKNSRQYEAIIEVPKGTTINVGRVEKQYTKTGALLEGDGDQILLPQGWPSKWIKEIREVPSR